jgi:predicted site-specific integrase-resolvase
MEEVVKAMSELTKDIQVISDVTSDISGKRSFVIQEFQKAIEKQQEFLKQNTLNTEQILNELGITRQTLARRREKGLILAININGRYLYFKPELLKGGRNG